jgi:hypothetical protein
MRGRLIAALVLGQAVYAGTVRIQPVFRKGETFTIEFKKSRGLVGVVGETVTPVEVEVLEAGEKGTTLAWVPGETRFADQTQISNPLVSAVAQVIRGLHFEIDLDNSGQYIGLRNEKELVFMLAGIREQMMERFMPLVAETHRRQLQAYLHQALSPSAIAAAATREAQVLFALNGMEVDEAAPLNLQKDTRGPFGAGIIPSKLSIRVARSDAGAKEAVVAFRQDFDTSTMPDMVLGLAPGLAAKDGVNVALYDEAQYVVDTGTNRVKSVVHFRTIEAAGGRRADTTEIRMTPNGQASP